MKKGNALVKLVMFLVVAGLLGTAGYIAYENHKPTEQQQGPEMPAPSVTVAKPIVKDVTGYSDFTGTTKAFETVTIRARIEGELKKVNFEDGSEVKKGDLLFEIEPAQYKSNYDSKLALVKSAKSDLLRAQQDLERVKKAVESNAVSKQEYDMRLSQRDMAQALVLKCEAELEKAELDLSYTKVLSPIDGKISRRFVDQGNLVGANDKTELALIVSIEPIYVYFNVSEKFYNQKLCGSIKGCLNLDSLVFEVALTGEDVYSYTGKLDYIDNTVDPETGTITLRGVLQNEDKTILPGMFVKIRFPSAQLSDAVLVEERAIGSDLDGKYIFVVGENNIIERRLIETSVLLGTMRVVSSGLSADEVYVTNGLQYVRPGAPVDPQFEQAKPAEGSNPGSSKEESLTVAKDSTQQENENN